LSKEQTAFYSNPNTGEIGLLYCIILYDISLLHLSKGCYFNRILC